LCYTLIGFTKRENIMRDILITLIVVIGCLYTLKKAYIGVLLWSWLSYMNPHRLAYGFAYNMPFAQITALVLLLSMIFSKEKQAIPINSLTFIWGCFIVWMGITTLLAYYPDAAYIQFKKVIKIQLMTVLTMILIDNMTKLRQLIWVIVLSISYYSVKGGVFTLLTGGTYRVWGPPGSFIEDNNTLAVAVLMVIALMMYLYQTAEKKWVKNALIFMVIFSLFTVLGSQSRGALLAIIAVGGFYWLKSKSKVYSGIFIAIAAVALLSFMPDSWYERMHTIENYEEDGSAMGRINAWKYAFNAANDNFFGVGFDSWSPETFLLYAPVPEDVHAAHSIYFSVLADHGWPGLIMFLLILFMSWQKLSKIIKKTKNDDSFKEYEILAKMLQIAFISYIVGGAFLSISYFDLPWHLVCFVLLLEQFVKRETIDDTAKI